MDWGRDCEGFETCGMKLCYDWDWRGSWAGGIYILIVLVCLS